jgi:HEPN domain-containing protein
METNQLIALLAEDEARSRPSRAERLRLLLDEYGREGIRFFPGGPISFMAFEEARQAYLHGLYVACTIMSQLCLEHMLAGLFRQAGRDDLDRATFELLLSEARSQRFLSEDEFALFDRLRTIRNPYAHPRAPTGKGSIIRRAADTDVAVEDVIVEDAELAIRGLLRLCRRHPFALGEDGADG